MAQDNDIYYKNWIIISHTTNLNLEFSIDNVNWQTSNYFGNLVDGDYTLFVKDDLGCSITKNFTIGAVSLIVDVDPYDYISKSNSIRFAKRVNYDCDVLITNENTLSCETDKPIKNKEKHTFLSCDKITTQIKTSYDNIEFKIIEDDNEILVPFVKITDNINKKQKLDAKAISLGGNKTGIYFINGNIYDFDTETQEGTYTLNGELPEWGKKGGVVVLDNANYPIIDVSYNDDYNVMQIVINASFVGEKIIGSVWNRDIYDVWEATIDMLPYIDKTFYTTIKLEKTGFDDVMYQSEIINVVDTYKAFKIEFWNNENTDVYIGNDIHHLIRIRGSKKIELDNTADVEKTDDAVYITDVQNYEKDVFLFEPVSDEIIRQLALALSHQNVLINGVSYSNPSFELDNDFDTNANVLAVTLNKSNRNNAIKGNEIMNIPEIISSGINDEYLIVQ